MISDAIKLTAAVFRLIHLALKPSRFIVSMTPSSPNSLQSSSKYNSTGIKMLVNTSLAAPQEVGTCRKLDSVRRVGKQINKTSTKVTYRFCACGSPIGQEVCVWSLIVAA